MLEALGLSGPESRLYIALIDHPRSTAADLADCCEMHPRVAARTLGQFVRRGLASRLPGKQARFIAAAPDVSIFPLLSKREEELNQVRAVVHQLAAAFRRASRHAHPAELVEVITGPQNIASRALALQDGAKKLLRVIDKPPYVTPDDLCRTEDQDERLRDGVVYRVLYDRGVLSRPGKLEEIRMQSAQGLKGRVLADAPLKLWMADNSAALVPIHNATYTIDAAFVVYPSALLDALIALFEREWQRATPIRFAGREDARAGGASSDARDEITNSLLPLLAAGLTDESIARALGLSLRTLQRRIHDLMRELNVATRFQAGLAIRERGWI